MLKRWVEPFTRSVGRLADPGTGYSRRKRKVKPVAIAFSVHAVVEALCEHSDVSQDAGLVFLDHPIHQR